MAIKSIIEYPNPLLKQICQAVPDPQRRGFTDMMRTLSDTFYANPGVGLAAPQIGYTWRMIVVDTRRHAKFGKHSHGLLQLINPTIISRSGRRTGREGCLSIPQYIAKVTRAEKIVLEAVTTNNMNVVLNIEGFEAVCIQHEIDHLDGILMLDRIRSIRSDLYRRSRE
jgi:peptide deformylase